MLGYISYLKARHYQRRKDWLQAAVQYKRAVVRGGAKNAERHYRLGFAMFKAKDWKQAEQYLGKAIKLAPHQSQWHFRHGFALEKMKRWGDALTSYDRAIELNPQHADCCLRLAVCLSALRRWPDAEAAIRRAIELDSGVPEYHRQLAEVLRRQEKVWQEVEALESAISLHGNDANWHFRLGETREAMKHYGAAADAYWAALKLKPAEPLWRYRLGYVLERHGRDDEASVQYDIAIQADPEDDGRAFGIGAYHQRFGRWDSAADAYQRHTAKQPLNAALHYRLGMAHDRCHRWQEAISAYETAVALNAEKPEWHYRLGFALERAGLLDRAAQAYAVAAQSREKHTPYWFYRLGHVRCQMGQHEYACAAFLCTRLDSALSHVEGQVSQAIATDETKTAFGKPYLLSLAQLKIERIREAIRGDASCAAWYYALGNEYEKLQDWDNAASAYRSAVARQNDHSPLWYYRLGYALTAAGQYEEACEAFLNTRVLRAPHGMPETELAKNSALKLTTSYTEYYESLPVARDVILYESFHGATLSCNPYAIFRQLIASTAFSHMTHVWAINDSDRIPEPYLSLPNVIYVRRESDLYLRYLCTAGYLINNNTFPAYFIRKADQIYVNTWHGTPWKTLGKDMKGRFLEHKNFVRNILHATHLISPNRHTSKILMHSHEVADVYTGVVAETGYPRVDLTVGATDARKAELRKQLGVPDDKKVVLYAPTWRGTHGSIAVDVQQLARDLDAMASSGYHVLFRGHSLMEKAILQGGLGASVVCARIDSNELLSIVDVLVTDYSSILFDFLPTRKRIVYYVHDLEQYQKERGLYFPPSRLPGAQCATIDEVVTALDAELVDEAAHREEVIREFASADDGHATRRVIDLVFHGVRDCVIELTSAKKSLLFYAGPFMPNGITSSAINLLGKIDKERYAVSLALDPNKVSSYPERLAQYEKLWDDVNRIGRVGGLNTTLDERWAMAQFTQNNQLCSAELWKLYEKAHKREFLRSFGYGKFDALINFEGYARLWVGIMGCGGTAVGTRKLIYQHNDKYSEWKTKWPYLEGVFRLYRNYTKVVSVSEPTRNLNRSKICAEFGLAEEAFDYCCNAIRGEDIVEASRQPMDPSHAELFRRPGKKLVSIGRMSPEKDHAKLIRAFATLNQEAPDTQLCILGDGPLRLELVSQIAGLGLTDHCHLLGQVPNPFPLLKAADGFVLASNHEGQPMVLLEALTLGVKTVATDIVGSRSVLAGRYGRLVENSENGLVDGMRAILQGTVGGECFDYRAYETTAMTDFYTRVLGEATAKCAMHHA